MEDSKALYIKMGKNKEVYISDADKAELGIIVAKLAAKSSRIFLSELFFYCAIRLRDHKELPVFTPDVDFVREGSVNVNYSYNPDAEFYLRVGAALCRTNLANYLRAILHFLCEKHRESGSLWIDSTPVHELPITRR